VSSGRILSYSKQERHREKKTERGIVGKILFGLVFVLALAVAFSILIKQNKEMERLQLKERDLRAELELAKLEQLEIMDLSNKAGSSEFVERIARDELGLVTADEYIFIED
jgi:cell division protein FtsB